jgi:transcriptional regulator with XRE-family HTH domain
MSDACTLLRKYLAGPPRITQIAFAKQVGAAQVTLSSWVCRKKRPGLKFALEIERITGIKASLWERSRLASTMQKAA